jgi:predicted secreted protein
MALMINGRVLNSEADLFREMGTNDREIAGDIHGLAYLMHGETNWNITPEEEAKMTREELEQEDNCRAQFWQSALSGARHFYREAAEWHEKSHDLYRKVKPLIELSKEERREVLTNYAKHLHAQGMQAHARIAHIANL